MVRVVDLSDQVLEVAGGSGFIGRAQRFVEAAAFIIRDEIVTVMEESDPSGRRYPIPGTKPPRREDGEEVAGKWYTASAPGQPPAHRTGNYAGNWQVSRPVVEGDQVRAGVYNPTTVGDGKHFLWFILEYGTSDQVNFRVAMQPRPHVRPAIDRAMPKINQLAKKFF